LNYEEKTLTAKPIFDGKVIKLDVLTVELPNGKEATREVVLHPGASAVVPISTNGEIYMTTQYRKPLDSNSYEIPAGKLDQGEDPLDAARRELKEETGLEAGDIRHLVSMHTAPGFSNEVVHLYCATDLKEGNSCADEDEFISVEKKTVSQLVQMVLNHEITDAKSIIGILLAEKIIKGEI
jgi:ADP-ribose pyrophosphatase